MSAKPINFSDMDNYGAGDGFFPAGPGRMEKMRFGTFDFKKGKGHEANCLIMVAQPLNANGSDNGEARTQYYPIGDGIELISPVKGEKGLFSQITFAEDSKFDKLWLNGDFGIFFEHLRKAGADMDEIGNDITNLDGKVFEFGMFVPKPRDNAKVKDEGSADGKPKQPKQVVVVVGLVDEKASKKGKGKEKDDEKPAKPKKEEVKVSDDPEEIVAAYIDAELNDSMDGEAALGFKLGIADFAKKKLNKDADVAKAAQSELKENFGTYLKTAGWSLDGSKLSKAA